MIISYFKILSKTFGKQTIYFTSFTLCTILYFNSIRVWGSGRGVGVSLNKTDIALKLLFCLGRNFIKITSFKFYKLSIFEIYNYKYLTNDGSIVLVAHACSSKSMDISFFTKFVKMMKLLHKKC